MDLLGNQVTNCAIQAGSEISSEPYPNWRSRCIDNLDCHYVKGLVPTQTQTRSEGRKRLLTLCAGPTNLCAHRKTGDNQCSPWEHHQQGWEQLEASATSLGILTTSLRVPRTRLGAPTTFLRAPGSADCRSGRCLKCRPQAWDCQQSVWEGRWQGWEHQRQVREHQESLLSSLGTSTSSLGMLLVSQEIISTTYGSTIYETHVFSLYSHLWIYIAAHLDMVCLDWLQAVHETNLSCAWNSQIVELRNTLWGCYDATLEMHLQAAIERSLEIHSEVVIQWTYRCTLRSWWSKFWDALRGHHRMNLEGIIKLDWIYVWRPWSNKFGDMHLEARVIQTGRQ